MEIETVSLNEIRERFYDEDIELLTSTDALVEITVLSNPAKKGHPQVQLRFGRPADAIDKSHPAYVYLANTEFTETKRDVEIMFDLRPDEAIWSCGDQSGLTFDEAWKCKGRAKQNIVAVKRRAVEVAL